MKRRKKGVGVGGHEILHGYEVLLFAALVNPNRISLWACFVGVIAIRPAETS